MLDNTEYMTTYDNALLLMKEDDSISTLQKAIRMLKEIPVEVLDVSNQLKECENRLCVYEKYFIARNLSYQDDIEEIDKAISLFAECLAYKDAAELKLACEKKKDDLINLDLKEKEEIYLESKMLMSSGDISKMEEAIEKMRNIKHYKDADALYLTWNAQRKEKVYCIAQNYAKEKTRDSLEKAIDAFKKIRGYKETDTFLREAQLARDKYIIDDIEKNKTLRYLLIILGFVAFIICLIIISSK